MLHLRHVYGRNLAARRLSKPAQDTACTVPSHFPQRIVGFRRSDRLQRMHVGAAEGSVGRWSMARRRWLMGESRSGGGGSRRKLKWRGWRGMAGLIGGDVRTTTEVRDGNGGGGGGPTGEDCDGWALEGVALTSPMATKSSL